MSESILGTRLPITWISLLSRGAALYDEPGSTLVNAAGSAARGEFASGAIWMRQAMERLRGAPLDTVPGSATRGGVRVVPRMRMGIDVADVIAGSGEGATAKVRIYLGRSFTSSNEPSLF